MLRSIFAPGLDASIDRWIFSAATAWVVRARATEPKQTKSKRICTSLLQATTDIPPTALQRSLHARDIRHRLSAANADFHRGFRNVIRTGREADLAALACTQMDPLEAAKIPDRRFIRAAAAQVHLHHFVAVPVRGILDGRADFSALRGPLRAQARISKTGIAQ